MTGRTPSEQHAAHIERNSTGSYYAWCSTCDWRSVTRRVEPIVYEAAKRHERESAPARVPSPENADSPGQQP